MANLTYMETPCCACGRTLVKKDTLFVNPLGNTFNPHLPVEEQFVSWKKQWSGLPLYKCGTCLRDKKRANPNRYCDVVKGYHAADTDKCDWKTCKNWSHYTTKDY